MASTPRRFIAMPDYAWDGAEVVSVEDANGVRQEAGRQVAQPDKSATDPPEGDISLTLSGEPEVHVEGVARLTRGGVVEDARWGWVRDGDDTATDLQFRQSPHVVGRRPDLIMQLINEIAAYSGRPVRPRLLALKSGDLLMSWRMSTWMPIWARDASGLSGSSEAIKLSRLDHDNDTWSDPFQGPIPFDLAGGAYFVSAVDITQFPDTGEIVMCVATNGSMTPGSAEPRVLWVYISQDDGDTWVLRHRLHFDGTFPDVVLDTDGDGDVDDTGPIQDWALELLDSGRLCLFMVTENYTWSLTSDDRGASWAATLVDTHGVNNQYAGHGVGATKARNGMVVFAVMLRSTSFPTGISTGGLAFTRDGQVFTEYLFPPTLPLQFESVDIAACISPDGWVHVYGTEHASRESGSGGAITQDWLWGRRLELRDPSLFDTVKDLVPYMDGAPDVSAPPAAFHIPDGAPLGDYGVPVGEDVPDPVRYYGFTGLDAVLYRGQVVLATVMIREGDQNVSNEQAKLGAFGLMVYRLNHWQPIQERVNNAYDGSAYEPEWPAQGRIYNETWDCYDYPENWDYTNVGGTGSFVVAGAEGGYFLVSGAPKYWHRTLSGNTHIGLSGNVRVIVHVESGGSLGTDQIAIKIQLSDGVNGSNFSIQLARVGADLKINLYDNLAGAQVGTTITIAGTGWAEILFAQHTIDSGVNTKPYLAARPYPRSTDPDWDEPYTLGVNGTSTATTPAAVSRLEWGHTQSGEPESWWKGVHISRCNSEVDAALVQAGVTYIDDDATNDRSTTGTGEPPLDNGLDNWMRTCRTLATPPMFYCRNTYARFRGEAITEGAWDYASGYAYAAQNITRQPVLQEWRSSTDGIKVPIILQDTTGEGFRPDAVAVFGHNCTGFTIQFNDVNSDVGWASPAVTFQYGLPNMPGFTPDRYYHIWAYSFASSVGWSFAIVNKRLTITGPAGETPWRPHQFKSDDGGQTYYVAISATSGGSTWAFRIVDNTGDTLILQSEPGDSGITTGGATDYNFSVFSDRFAVMCGHFFETAAGVSYEFCRIQTRATIHPDSGRDFARIGRLILGKSIEISTPDFERGWTTGFDTGSIIVEQPTGAAYSHRQRPILRTWQADRPWMLPPPEADAVFSSPDSQPSRASWAQWIDATRRLEGGGTACALVWDGDRFVGFAGEELVQCAADPLGLAMCHVTGMGEITNIAFDGRTLNLPEGSTCVARPVSHIRGLTFRETL